MCFRKGYYLNNALDKQKVKHVEAHNTLKGSQRI